MKKLLFILMFMLFSVQSFALSSNQEKLLSIAKSEGDRYGYGVIIQAILMQETHAGKLGRIGDDGKSLGVMQVSMAMADDIYKYELNRKYDKNVVKKLLTTNDNYAIFMGTKAFVRLVKIFDGDLDKAILGYNTGIGNIRKKGLDFDPNEYLKGVKEYIRRFKEGTSPH